MGGDMYRGRNLIFIVSQPRSGSTLLQHILGSHPDVATAGEPWLMLHPLYALKTSGIQTEYNAEYARVALDDTLRLLPEKREAYIHAVRLAYAHIYKRLRALSGKTYFLDKTPRYYHIIPELLEVFPEAKMILLTRNPLAVLSSIVQVNLNGDWRKLRCEDRRHDLMSAPSMLSSSLRDFGERLVLMQYEKLVTNPSGEIRDLCDKLQIAYHGDMLIYGGKLSLHGRHVDPKSIYKHDRPVDHYMEAWKRHLQPPQLAKFGRSYLAHLGESTLARLGYSYSELAQALPRPSRMHITVSWDFLMKSRKACPRFASAWMSMVYHMQRHDVLHALAQLARRLLQRFARACIHFAVLMTPFFIWPCMPHAHGTFK